MDSRLGVLHERWCGSGSARSDGHAVALATSGDSGDVYTDSNAVLPDGTAAAHGHNTGVHL